MDLVDSNSQRDEDSDGETQIRDVSRLSELNAPAQMMLSLFERDTSQYSNLIDIYDMLPKFTASDRKSTDLSQAETIRHCKIGNTSYKVIIRPAIMRDEDNGSNVLIYPGEREELVEAVLRKFAVEGQATLNGKEIGVTFTLYQLQKELKKRKHGYSFVEIREALFVLRGATLECFTGDGITVISSGFFSTIALTTKEDWKKNTKSSYCMAMFNPLVTQSVMTMSWRPYNYLVNMAMSSPLARFLHKKMSHNYKQARADTPYCFHLVRFLSESERGLSKRMSENVRAMKNALDHLIKHNVILHYDFDKIQEGKAILDVKITIYPHHDFVNDIISANTEMKNKTQTLENLNRASTIDAIKRSISPSSKGAQTGRVKKSATA